MQTQQAPNHLPQPLFTQLPILALFVLALVGLILAPIVLNETESNTQVADLLCLAALESPHIVGVFPILYYSILLSLVAAGIFLTYRNVNGSAARGLSLLVVLGLVGLLWLANPVAPAGAADSASDTVCLLRDGTLPMIGDLNMNGRDIQNVGVLAAPTGRAATITVCPANALSTEQCDYVADGMADSTVIRTAIDRLPADGGVVLLREGTFLITGPVYVANRSNVTLDCAGAILQVGINGGDSTMLSFDTSTYITVRNCILDGDFAVRGGRWTGIWFYRCQYCVAEHNTLRNFGGERFKLYVHNSQHVKVLDNTLINNTFVGIGLESTHAISGEPWIDWELQDIQVIGNSVLDHQASGTGDSPYYMWHGGPGDNMAPAKGIVFARNMNDPTAAIALRIGGNYRVDARVVDNPQLATTIAGGAAVVYNPYEVSYGVVQGNGLYGGGVLVSRAAHFVVVDSNTIIEQTVSGGGAGIRKANGAHITATNNILQGPQAVIDPVDVRHGNTIGGLRDENSGSSTGTGAQQAIAHGLNFTPKAAQIILWNIENAAAPYHSAPPDATNIYVTATNNKDWGWATAP